MFFHRPNDKKTRPPFSWILRRCVRPTNSEVFTSQLNPSDDPYWLMVRALAFHCIRKVQGLNYQVALQEKLNIYLHENEIEFKDSVHPNIRI